MEGWRLVAAGAVAIAPRPRVTRHGELPSLRPYRDLRWPSAECAAGRYLGTDGINAGLAILSGERWGAAPRAAPEDAVRLAIEFQYCRRLRACRPPADPACCQSGR